MRIAVTGAGGHVGKVIVHELVRQGFDVYPIYRSVPEPKIDKAIIADLGRDPLPHLDFKPDFFVHAAASIPSGNIDVKRVVANNRAMDDSVIDYCRTMQIPLIYFSTAYMYAATSGSRPHKETDPVAPSGDYYEAKYKSECLIASVLQKYVILRLSSPYGIYKKTENVLGKFVRHALEGKDIVLLGKGKKVQDFIHENDIARITMHCMTSSITGTFNCVYGQSVSMRALAETILGLLPETKSKIKFSGVDDANENGNFRFSNSSLHSVGIVAQITLEQGLRQLVQHFRNNPSVL